MPTDLSKVQEIKEWVRPYYLKWLFSKLFPRRYPSYFRDCWSYPIATPSGPTGKRDVLFLPAADMHARTQRSEHFATTLAERGFRCFYLNPHLGREFSQPRPFSDAMRVTKIRPNLYEVHVHLPREPVYHHRRLLPIETTLVADALCDIFGRFRTDNLAIISSFPLWFDLALELQSKWKSTLIYDCHDLWQGFGNIGESILADEAKFFDLSDRVLFSAEGLRTAAVQLNPQLAAKSTVVRNAAGPMWFEVQRPPAPADVVTIGYVGSLSSWFDFDMVEAAASRHSEWQFVLIGRAESPEVAKLARFKNVRMLGEVPYAELPNHVSKFNVAIIPFRLTPLTMMTNPIKLYEYLACGLPVVSSALPEVLPFSGVAYIAQDRHDFVVKLEDALSAPATLEETRRDAVRDETWVDRCMQIESFL